MMAEMDLAPKDLGLEAAVDTLAATDSPRDMPAPKDLKPEKVHVHRANKRSNRPIP